jgi:DNA-binding NtrC family response regulator
VRLPDQSGLEVYRQIRRVDARIPVIFVTIIKGADSAIEAMKEGAFDYLFKPFDPERLRQVVGEALEVSCRMRPGRNRRRGPGPRRGRHHRRHLSILRLLP